MRVLISAFGSYGDILPFVAIGSEFKSRGHAVRLYANAAFEPHVRKAGLEFCATGTAEDHEAALRSPNITHPLKAWDLLVPYMDKYLRQSYRAMAADVLPGNSVVVGSSPFAFSIRSLHETHGVPAAVVHLLPVMLRSQFQTPRYRAWLSGRPMPPVVNRFLYAAVDKLVLDRTIGTVLNRHRLELGLGPVLRPFHDWLHSADITIGMFPEWFATPQPDWPPGVRLVGFPMSDDGKDLTRDLEAFLSAGAPPVAFTAGTATAVAHGFFATSVEACRRSGHRGILLTRYVDNIPKALPDNVIWVDHAPFRPLLPRLAAFVHHGGVGTTSHALRAGVPQLIRPMAYDQFDHAERTRRLGVAEVLTVRKYTASAAAASLDRLVRDAALKALCKKFTHKFEGDAVAKACDVILHHHSVAKLGMKV